MSRLTIAVLAAAAVLLGSARGAHACSCIGPNPACQAFWTTDAVFDATVVAIGSATRPEDIGGRIVDMREKVVTVAVRQSWKGVDAGPLDIVTAWDGAGCGFDFKAGERYLVFAHRRATDGRLVASSCGLTRVFDGGGDTARFLESLSRPATGARIFGSVTLHQRFLNPSKPGTPTPLDLPVHLTGGGVERTMVSDGGRYEFSALVPGPYRVDVSLPDGYSTNAPSRSANVENPYACAEHDFGISAAGRITGQVVGPDGRAVKDVPVELMDADATVDPRADPHYGPQVMTARTLDGGYYEFRDMAPGRYLVGVNLRDLPGDNNPRARTFYPEPGSAPQPIALALGQVVDLGAWTLPPPLKVVAVSGVIAWPDGKPAAGFGVTAWDVTGGRTTQMRGAGRATSDAQGYFSLRLREGRTYTLTAAPISGNGRYATDVRNVQVSEPMGVLHVTIVKSQQDQH